MKYILEAMIKNYGMQNILYDLIFIVEEEAKKDKQNNVDYLKTLQFNLTTALTNYKSREMN